MKNIYFWDNAGEKGFSTKDLYANAGGHSSGQHSGGIVVLAENEEEAVTLFIEYQGRKDWDCEDVRGYLMSTITKFDKENGVVYFGNGDC
jgi:hypothetical protein